MTLRLDPLFCLWNVIFTEDSMQIVVYNGGIWCATGSGFFKFLTTLKLLKTTKITISQKTPFFKITKK